MQGMLGAPNDNDNDKPLTEEGGKKLGIVVCSVLIMLSVIGFGSFTYYTKFYDQGIIKSS